MKNLGINEKTYNYLIIGAENIKFSVTKAIKEKHAHALVGGTKKKNNIEKYNNDVLHIGFYYITKSFKAKFTKEKM